jgi:UDPglucose 6-dehydrogenase
VIGTSGANRVVWGRYARRKSLSHLTVIGAGYVGLVTGACFADLGNTVTCLDIDEARIHGLNRGVLPIYEPGLKELVERNRESGRLRFTTDYQQACAEAQFVFIAVNTPSGQEGEADMAQVRSAIESLASAVNGPVIVVNKSTMPIGTGDWVTAILERLGPPDLEYAVVSNPEFLREGCAIADFQEPDRVVLGSTDEAAARRVAELYKPLSPGDILITDLRTAEMIKYASNAFLATKISFINEIASICEKLGGDVKTVARGMGLDKRIGTAFLEAGLGYGGSCFPKDVKALEHMAAVNGCHPQLLRAVMEINRDARRSVMWKLRQRLGSLEDRVVAVLGLSFKPNTDDLRESAALEIIHLLSAEGARVRAYDPVAMDKARDLVKGVEFCDDAYATADGADALLVVTDWNEFKQLDMARIKRSMTNPLLIDGRNIYDPAQLRRLGFDYYGVGRGPDPNGLNGAAGGTPRRIRAGV